MVILNILFSVYRSLGVVIWELFEFGSQPHRHLSDDEVLTFVIRERQITLAQPRLKLSHADYWSVLTLSALYIRDNCGVEKFKP